MLKVVELPINMGNPLDLIARRKELGTQTPGEPVVPVVEITQPYTPSSSGALTFNEPHLKATSTAAQVTPVELSPMKIKDTNACIDAFSDTMGVDLGPSLKKAP